MSLVCMVSLMAGYIHNCLLMRLSMLVSSFNTGNFLEGRVMDPPPHHVVVGLFVWIGTTHTVRVSMESCIVTSTPLLHPNQSECHDVNLGRYYLEIIYANLNHTNPCVFGAI